MYIVLGVLIYLIIGCLIAYLGGKFGKRSGLSELDIHLIAVFWPLGPIFLPLIVLQVLVDLFYKKGKSK